MGARPGRDERASQPRERRRCGWSLDAPCARDDGWELRALRRRRTGFSARAFSWPEEEGFVDVGRWRIRRDSGDRCDRPGEMAGDRVRVCIRMTLRFLVREDDRTEEMLLRTRASHVGASDGADLFVAPNKSSSAKTWDTAMHNDDHVRDFLKHAVLPCCISITPEAGVRCRTRR